MNELLFTIGACLAVEKVVELGYFLSQCAGFPVIARHYFGCYVTPRVSRLALYGEKDGMQMLSNNQSCVFNLVCVASMVTHSTLGPICCLFLLLLANGRFRLICAFALSFAWMLVFELFALVAWSCVCYMQWFPPLVITIHPWAIFVAFLITHQIPLILRWDRRRLTSDFLYLYSVTFPLVVLAVAALVRPSMCRYDVIQECIRGFFAFAHFLPYNLFHRYAHHTSNTLWSIHKSHHMSVNINKGDNGTIPITEMLIEPGRLFSPCWMRVFDDLYQLTRDDHFYGSVLAVDEHQLHHAFISNNTVVPLGVAADLHPMFKQDLLAHRSMSTLATRLARKSMAMHSAERNDLHQLRAVQSVYLRLYKRLFLVPDELAREIEVAVAD